MIFSYLRSNWSCVKYFKIFKMAAILNRQYFFTGSYTGSWINQKDSHEHFRHFELLIIITSLTRVINIEGRLWGHLVTSSMTTSSWKYFFGIIWEDLFISEVKLKLCLIFQNLIFQISKWPLFWARDKLFLPEVIPEDEYTRKIAMSIADILSFWSTP